MRVAPYYPKKIEWHEPGLRVFYTFFLFVEQTGSAMAEASRERVRHNGGIYPFSLLLVTVDEPLSLLLCLPSPLHPLWLQGVNQHIVPCSHSCGCGVTRPWGPAMLSQPWCLLERIPKVGSNDSAPIAPVGKSTPSWGVWGLLCK